VRSFGDYPVRRARGELFGKEEKEAQYWTDNEQRISDYYYKSLTCYLLTDYQFAINTSVTHSAVSAVQIIYFSLPTIKKNCSREARKFLAPGRSGGYILYGGIGYSWVLSLEIASFHGLAPRVLKWLLVFGNILRK
jgi:hypothetical protein